MELKKKVIYITFKESNLLLPLFGEHDKNLAQIEKALGVFTASRGNTLSISGKAEAVQKAKAVLESLYNDLTRGVKITGEDIKALINMAAKLPEEDIKNPAHIIIKTPKRNIVPFTQNQLLYLQSLQQKDIVFASGPAGTGKTYMAVACAVKMFSNREVERIILSRPAVEAGEKLGFLPGDIKEKVDPYLRPLYDALLDMLSAEALRKHLENGEIEIAPLAFMRGRTLNNAFIILDEAQNTTATQMKMFLTRLGHHSHIAITGDPSQIDLDTKNKSGLVDALEKLSNIDEIGFINFSDRDVIRHPLTTKIIQAYDKASSAELKNKKSKARKDNGA